MLRERRLGFRDACQAAGHDCWEIKRDLQLSGPESDEQLVTAIRQRCASANGPLAVYVPSDGEARWFLRLCQNYALRVPYDVSIIGTGNHAASCLREEPELSSIIFPWHVVGQVTAGQLHRIQQGLNPGPTEVISVYQVAERASTAVRLNSDPVIDQALQWLNNNLTHGQPLAGLVAALSLSKPTICRKFKESIGMSPRENMSN